MSGSVGHLVKVHKITPTVGNERGDIEIKDYVVLPHGQDNCLSPRSLIVDFTMIHDRYGRSHPHSNGKLTHTLSNRSSHTDDTSKNKARSKIQSYKRLYTPSIV